MQYGLIPIVCVGETLEERDAGREQDVVRGQVVAGLEEVGLTDADQLVIAYETRLGNRYGSYRDTRPGAGNTRFYPIPFTRHVW